MSHVIATKQFYSGSYEGPASAHRSARGEAKGLFSALAVMYLFFGGSGAGAVVVLSVLEFRDAQRHQGQARRAAVARAGLRGSAGTAASIAGSGRSLGLPRNFYARAWPLAFVLLGAGALCLLCDIGRPDRLLALVAHPSLSAIAVGAWAIAVCLLVAGAFTALSLFEGMDMPPTGVRALGFVGVISGLVTAVYTGVLLQGMASVVFWQTAFVPAAFVCSSLSCGIASVFAALSFTEARQPLNAFAVRLAQVDSALIVLEAMCLAGLLAVGFATPGAHDAAWSLAGGEYRWLFWGGLVGVGLVAPFVLERISAPERRRALLLWTGCLVLAGGLALRWCMVLAARYDVTQIPGAVYGLASAVL